MVCHKQLKIPKTILTLKRKKAHREEITKKMKKEKWK